MIGKSSRARYNVPLAGLFTLLFMSVFLATSSPNASAASLLDVRGDGCYSGINQLGRMTQFLGPGFTLGLVNAIVNVPIYDWDADTTTLKYTDSRSTDRVYGKPVGYLKKFTFNTMPLPNVRWAARYLTQQLPYDAALIGSLFGARLGVREPNPFIANPFIYQQGAIINANGFPAFPIFGGGKATTPQNPDSYQLGINNFSQTTVDGIKDAYNAGGGLLTEDKLNDIKNNPSLKNYSIDNLEHKIANNLFGFATKTYSVNGNTNAGDWCYETLSSNKKVPAYAFSVVSADGFPILPFTFPGFFYSIVTLLMGKGPSASGMTIYPRSLNGKDMLDCYGRGIQPTVVPTNHRMGETGHFLIPYDPFWFFLSTAIDLGAFGGNYIVRNLPIPQVKYETYTNGFAQAFSLISFDLPDELKNREVDLQDSKIFSVDHRVLAGVDDRERDPHSKSQNGQVFNPNLFIKLKKPYHLTPTVTQNGAAPTRTPDGQPVKLDINVHKGGYDKGTNHSNPYTPSVTNGGPTRADDGRYFSRARVMKITVNPGTTSNPIKDPAGRGSGFFGHLGDFQGWFDGGKDSICRFWREKLGVDLSGADNKTKDCDQEGEYGIDMPSKPWSPNDVNDTILKTIEFTIPPETPPGTKFCYAVYLDNYSNDIKYRGTDYYNPSVWNYNNGYTAYPDKRSLSRAYCVISGYKPSFQVRGGDLFAQGGVHTTVNIKERLPVGSNELRAYGSWAEYGAIVAGPIKNLGTGALYRPGFEGAKPDNRGYLSLSNKYDGANPAFGYYQTTINDGFDGVVDRLSTRRSNAKNVTLVGDANCYDLAAKTIYLDGCKSGDYYVPANGYKVATRNPDADIGANKSLVFLVENGARLNLATDIKTPGQYSSVSEISQVVFTPAAAGKAFLLNVNDNVRRVDAWLLNPSGSINTCFAEAAGSTDVPRSKNQPDGATNACYQNLLAVNGPVSAKFLYLRRSGGQDQDPNGGATLHSIPGEMFNLRADAYLWAANQMNAGGAKFVTQDEQILPERF